MRIPTRKEALALVPATLALFAPAWIAAPAQAGIFHRHPTLSAIGAGLAAHHVAKHAGQHAGHRNFAERHPIITGLGAGLATHHFLKRH